MKKASGTTTTTTLSIVLLLLCIIISNINCFNQVVQILADDSSSDSGINHNDTTNSNSTGSVVTHYVSSNSTHNSGDCKDYDNPCKDIDYALQFTKSWEHLSLRGEFHLQNPLQIQVPFITIESDPGTTALINCSRDSNPGQTHNLDAFQLRSVVNLTNIEIVNCKNAIDVNVGNPNDLSRQVHLTSLIIHGNVLGINSFQSAINVINCTIYNNTVDSSPNRNGGTGGGVSLTQGAASFSGNRIFNNTGGNMDNAGGGIYAFQSRVISIDDEIYGNFATDRGAGAYFFGGEIFIRNSKIYNNTILNGASQAGGGGMNIPPKIGGGGGIYLNSGTVNITDTEVYGNVILNNIGQGFGGNNNIIQFANGGGMFIDSSTVYSKNVKFYANSVLKGNLSNEAVNSTGDQDQVMRIGRSGGGLYISQSSIVMYETYLTNNYAFGSIDGYSGGGGLFIDRGTNIFYGLQVYGNTITQGGGAGVYSAHGTTIIYGEGPLQPGQPCYNNPSGICYVGKSFINNNSLIGDGRLQTNQNKGDSGDIGGGGILAEKATMVMYHVEISNNLVTPYGEGGAMKVNLATVVGYNITCENNTVLVVNSSTAFSNLHDEMARGGGAVLNRSSLQFMNVTWGNNRVKLLNASASDPEQPESDVVCFESTVVIYSDLSYINASADNFYYPPPPPGPPGPPYGPNPPYYGPCNPWNPMNPCNDTNLMNSTHAYDAIGVDCDVCTVYYDGILECDGNNGGDYNFTYPPIDPSQSKINLKHKVNEKNGTPELKANKIYEIVITAKDAAGNIDPKGGGEDWDIHIWNLDKQKWISDINDRLKIADMNNGSYAIYFYLIENAKYEISVMQGKHNLAGSPLTIQVVDGIIPDSSSVFNSRGSTSNERNFNKGWVWLLVLGLVALAGLAFVVIAIIILNRKEQARLRNDDYTNTRGGESRGDGRRGGGGSNDVKYVGRQDNNNNNNNRGGYGAVSSRHEEDEEEAAASAQHRSDRRDIPGVVVEEEQ